jgi:hypothetical protein
MEYKSIKNALQSVQVDSSKNITGKITLTETLLDQVKSLSNAGLMDSSLVVNVDGQKKTINAEDLTSSHINAEITLTIEGQSVKDEYFIGESWDDLLAYYSYIQTPPTALYLHSLDQVIDKDSADEKYNNLVSLSHFSRILGLVADLSPADSWILIYGQKIDIPKSFKADALAHTISILPLTRIMEEEIHSDAKQNLLKSVLVDLLSKVKLEKRFQYVVENFSVIFTNFMLGYQSFVSDYSFDKVRREYEEKRTEYISKINNAFQDLGSKFILLPAPLWLAITQAKSVHDAKGNLIDIELFKNIDILFITLLVAVFLFLLVLGQLSYLDSLKKEYSLLFARLKSDYPDIEYDAETELKPLNSRHLSVWLQLWAVNIINFVLTIFSIVIVVSVF